MAYNSGRHSIQIGILYSLPQMSFFYAGSSLCLPGSGSESFCHYRLVFIHDLKLYHIAFLGVCYPGRKIYQSIFSLKFGIKSHSRRSEIIQTEMGLRHTDHGHIPVNASIKGKVRHLGIYICPVLIVRYYSQISFSLFQRLCCVYTEGGISAFVFADFFVVEINLCDRIYSFKFQIDFIICRYVRSFNGL